jgi:hypothetical protein
MIHIPISFRDFSTLCAWGISGTGPSAVTAIARGMTVFSSSAGTPGVEPLPEEVFFGENLLNSFGVGIGLGRRRGGRQERNARGSQNISELHGLTLDGVKIPASRKACHWSDLSK